MPEVLIPPSIKPVSPVERSLLDDLTTTFIPKFGRGNTQRQTWGDPLQSFRLKFQGLNAYDRARMNGVISAARGKYATIRFTPGIAARGSFPAPELLTNNDFSNGTTGWVGYFNETLTANDRILKVVRTQNDAAHGTGFGNSSALSTMTQYAPYIARFYGFAGQQNDAAANISMVLRAGITAGAVDFGTVTLATGAGALASMAFVPYSVASDYLTFMILGNVSAGLVGDTGYIGYTSLSRCALVDGGGSAILYSDQLDNGAWAATGATVSANVGIAPDGTSTADALVETTANSGHYIAQSIAVNAGTTSDLMVSVAVKSNAVRGFCAIQMLENSGGTSVVAYVNLSTGAIGTTSAGAGWASLRVFTAPMGNGWYQITLVARKTSVATTVQLILNNASADGTASYTGSTSASVLYWRSTLHYSQVPQRLIQTVASSSNPVSQSGNALYVKGLPASTTGLLLAGDWFEINGEIKQCTAQLDSDASGLGYLQFAPGIVTPAQDNDAIIINNPMGRFMLGGDPKVTESFGLYTDYEFDLVEVCQ
jgi:hypothetical protein